VRGSVRQLVLFDVADEIRLRDLAGALNIAIPERAPAFSKPAPDYVRFERPPVIEPIKVEGFDAARIRAVSVITQGAPESFAYRDGARILG